MGWVNMQLLHYLLLIPSVTEIVHEVGGSKIIIRNSNIRIKDLHTELTVLQPEGVIYWKYIIIFVLSR